MADYIRFNGEDRNGTEQTNVALNFGGQPFALWAGPLGLAAGIEWREESAYDRPDAFANSAPLFITNESRTSSATRDATSGEYSLWEAYTEVSVPLLRDVPLAAALDLDAAVRYSDYDTFGSTTTSKFGVAWRPVESLLVRGTYSEGFRAPSILELFQGERQTTFQAVDPCNGGGAGRPGCAGVPSTYNQNQFGAGTLRGTVGGNENLQPETADTYSAGLAYTPAWADGMSFTADWWQIEIQDAIASQTAQQILNSCANRAGVFCALVRRAPTGEVLDLRQAVVNFSRIEVEGIDLTWRYGFDTGLGRFEALLDGAHLMHFKTFATQPDGTVLVDERAGKGDTPRATYPKWKAQAGLRWSQGPYSAGWRARYVGSTTDVPNNALNGGTTESVTYHDAQFGFEWERFRTNFTVGVDNVFDQSPPASRANNPINFDIYTYDVRGTYWYVKIATKL
jgi:outer membrane receptor protein involved in Fe transport